MVDPKDSSLLIITWAAPQVNPNCATLYKVQINSAMDFSNTTSIKWATWEPCYHINVTIAGQNLNAELGVEKKKTFETPAGVISEVNNLKLEPTDKTLVVTWDEPTKSKSCVTAYRVVVWDSDTQETVYDHENEQMMANLADMKACQKLTVQVTPISRTGDGVLLKKETEIFQRAASALSPVKAVETQSRQLKLATMFVDGLYLCPINELKVTCVPEGGNAAPKVQSVHLISKVPAVNETFEVVVHALEPYVRYDCSASVKNVFGSWSSDSFNTTLQTLEDCMLHWTTSEYLTLKDFNLFSSTWEPR